MHPDSGCGCHAGDHESYEMYKELFHPVIEMYHKGFKIATDRYGTKFSLIFYLEFPIKIILVENRNLH